MYGESTEYLDIKLWTIEEGDCFTEEDIKKAAKVCVVGATIVKELFGNQHPIGKTIRFKSIPMRVVGVLKSKGYNSWGMDQDNVIIAPYTTVMKRINAQTYFSSIVCSAITEELSDAAIEELTQMLRDNHKLKGDAVDDFTIHSQAEWMETMSSTMDTVTLILVVAAAFSLLVAGIGIMNIMLVSAHQRNWSSHGRRSNGPRHFTAVPDRGCTHQCHRWTIRHPFRLHRRRNPYSYDGYAQQCSSMVNICFVHGMCFHRYALRLHSCTKSS